MGASPRFSLRLLLTAALLGAIALAAPAPAAADWTCAAGTVRGTVLGQAIADPVTAGAHDRECTTASAALASGALPSPLDAIGTAATVSRGEGPARQVLATGALGNLTLQAIPGLPVDLPRATVPDSLGGVDLTAVPVTLAGVTLGTVDLRPALHPLVPAPQLGTTDLLRVDGARAIAGGRCLDGRPDLFGAKQLSGVQALGEVLSLTEPLTRSTSLSTGAPIDPSAGKEHLDLVDTSGLLLPLGVTLADVHALLGDVLDGLPDIPLPTVPATVEVTPGERIASADALVQRALRVKATVGTLTVADLVVGEAAVSARGVDCTAAAESDATINSAGDALLRCTKRRLVLENVVRQGRRVKLLGFADRRYAGRTVAIRLTTTGRRVARAKVRRDGRFATTAALPPRRWIGTNKARYQASLGRERSHPLKLTRRMVLTGMAARGGKVVISGRVVPPLATPVRSIVVQRRVTCRRNEVVGRFRPRSDGRFRIVLDAPEGEQAAVYRLGTRVRKNRTNAKTYPTFTLPRAVDLR